MPSCSGMDFPRPAAQDDSLQQLWGEPLAQSRMYECLGRFRCMGNYKCYGGYSGRLCGDVEAYNYFSVGGEVTIPCPAKKRHKIALTAALVLTVLAVRYQRRRRGAYGPPEHPTSAATYM